MDTAVPTPSPTIDPLKPCVKRLELHKVQMSKTLLNVALFAFFLGIFLCSACVCCMWCISSRVSYSVEEGLSNTFDGVSLQERLNQIKGIATGRRGGDASTEDPREQRSRRVEMSRLRYKRVSVREEGEDEEGGRRGVAQGDSPLQQQA